MTEDTRYGGSYEYDARGGGHMMPGEVEIQVTDDFNRKGNERPRGASTMKQRVSSKEMTMRKMNHKPLDDSMSSNGGDIPDPVAPTVTVAKSSRQSTSTRKSAVGVACYEDGHPKYRLDNEGVKMGKYVFDEDRDRYVFKKYKTYNGSGLDPNGNPYPPLPRLSDNE